MQQKQKKRIFSWPNFWDSEDHSYKYPCKWHLFAKKLYLCLLFNCFRQWQQVGKLFEPRF